LSNVDRFSVKSLTGLGFSCRRFRAIGQTSEGRALFVVFTLRRRGTDTLIRAISARYMHRKEADHYAKTCKT